MAGSVGSALMMLSSLDDNISIFFQFLAIVPISQILSGLYEQQINHFFFLKLISTKNLSIAVLVDISF